ncbi:uncharacterized protein TRAVEDRAFT_51238 [Trametes versicolor FP-101664 SS1]|uniref:uncharacterized protein n=1 Tax=Trametes versicolor (strain FP-101664) TaxID=717944 RepID=UPI0004623BE4|nr:uncharacterized protein TRAVEDRAFT_51238 [Trametes versicolor FP-101664 SS1]EIW55112.1 hypothetical protein TRAVEDRAFT_51238 [Trametes versicolor FP-101664 SS1]
MLYPILRRLVTAFDGNPDAELWKHVVHRSGPICEYDVFDGWLAVFCVWTDEGQWKAGPLPPLLAIPRPPPPVVRPGPRPQLLQPTRRMRLAKMISAPLKAHARKYEAGPSMKRESQLQEEEASADTTADDTLSGQSILTAEKYSASYTLDGVPYLTVDVGSIPPEYCEADVTIVDNRATSPCQMIAGHMASVATAKDVGGPLNALAPAPQ